MSNKKIHTSDLLFGTSLKSIRKHLKLTQNKFAEPLSISGSYVSNLEKGEATPSEAVLREMLSYYKIRREYLEKCEGDMFMSVSEQIADATADPYSSLDLTEFTEAQIQIIKMTFALMDGKSEKEKTRILLEDFARRAKGE